VTAGSKNSSHAFEGLLPGLLFALLVIGVYADPLFYRRNFAGRDLVVYNLPMEKAIHDAYAQNRLPLWMPEISGGRPLLPNPNAGSLYPVRPLLSVLPFPLAMRFFPLLHWVAAGVGMMVLLRSLRVSPSAAWVGAVTYVFSGVGVAEVFFPNLHPGMALLPWILWALRRPAGSRSGQILLLSFLFGLILLAGDVFSIGMALISSVLWISLEMVRESRPRALLALTVAFGLAVLLAAPQIVATALWIPETNRAVLGMKLHESLFFSVHPLRLLELVVPFPFGANWTIENTEVWGWPVFRGKAMGMFTTLYAGAFALIALVTSRKVRSEGFSFGRCLFVLSLAVSAIPSLIPSAWEHLASPLPLRNPEKFSVGLVLALALLSGLTFDRLRELHSARRWPLAVGAVLAVLAGASALFPEAAGRLAVSLIGANSRILASIASKKVPAALADGGLLWTATLIAIDQLRGKRVPALVTSLTLLTVVPIAASRRIGLTLNEEEIFAPTRFARFLERVDPRRAYRTLGEAIYLPQSPLLFRYAEPSDAYTDTQRRLWIELVPSLWGRGSVFNHDFDTGDFARMETLRRFSAAAAGYSDSAPFFRSLALRWGIRARDQTPISGYRRFAGDWLQDWDELEETPPDIRLVSRWVEETGVLGSAAALPRLKSGEIVVETGRRGRGASRGGIVHVLRNDPARLIVEALTTDPSWLFVLRGFWSHRVIRVDGHPVEDFPAQLAFSAVAVPPGRHRIDWTEKLPGGTVSLWGPVLYVLAALTMVFRARRARRESHP
jgi:hypothetical protein